MKHLLYIIPIFILISCSDNSTSGEEEFEPYQIGTWMITSPETATWIGEDAMQKTASAEGDTIYVSNPESQGIEIEEDTLGNQGSFNFVITDSTVNSQTYETGKTPRASVEFDYYNPNFSLVGGGGGLNSNSDRIRWSLSYFYYCGEVQEDPEFFNIVFKDPESDDTIEVYRFTMIGIKDTLEDLLC